MNHLANGNPYGPAGATLFLYNFRTAVFSALEDRILKSGRALRQTVRATVCTVPNRECKQVLNVGVVTGPAVVPEQD